MFGLANNPVLILLFRPWIVFLVYELLAILRNSVDTTNNTATLMIADWRCNWKSLLRAQIE